MTVNYWLYVSKSTTPTEQAATTFENIVRNAQVKNAVLGITGALIVGGGHFGQIIEGPPEGLLTLRSVIMTDNRHTEVRTISDGKTEKRRFGGWSLAYSGASMVVSRALQRALRDTAQGSADAGAELLQLMDEIVAPLGRQ